ncbi:unnamed protein product [Cylindrotheca closterium]|uniref:Uncharacterized protein n=1 Tax=Cylindrotheca closterium TaxID=2856 RepID=A0AAD2CEV5_9STRA|nr:unnamed protein product [Cylindrotheca closterium]
MESSSFVLPVHNASTIQHVSADEEGEEDHFEPPSEEDVLVYQACIADTDGFGGSVTDDFNTNTIVSRDYLCWWSGQSRTNGTRSGSGHDIAEHGQDDSNDNRQKLQGRTAVGLSANPDDAILQLDCQEESLSNTDRCMVVDAGFSVFYSGELLDNDEDGLEDIFRNELQTAVESGALNSANDQIVSIRITDPATYRPFRGGDAVHPPVPPSELDLVPRDDATCPL